MPRVSRLLLILACLACFPAQPSTSAQGTYALVDLGPTALTDDGDPRCQSVGAGAEGISPTGIVVGQRVVSEDRIVPAATDGTDDAWGRLKAPAKGGSALDANSGGLIVGFTNVPTEESAPCGYYRLSTLPAAWEDGERIELSTGARAFGRAEAVNDAGVIVGSLQDDPFASRHPAVWVDGEVAELPFAPNYGEGYASDVNTDGVIVGVNTGYDAMGMPQDVGVVWRDGEVTILEFGDAMGAAAVAINDEGAIAGAIYARNENESVVALPVVWTGGEATTLPAPDGVFATVPYGINEAGDLAGIAVGGDGAFEAVAWLDGELVLLSDLVPDAEGWTFRMAKDIGDDGTIVGWGEVDGEFRGFILRPAA